MWSCSELYWVPYDCGVSCQALRWVLRLIHVPYVSIVPFSPEPIYGQFTSFLLLKFYLQKKKSHI